MRHHFVDVNKMIGVAVATLTRARDETVTTGGHILDDVAVANLTRARDETITPNSGVLVATRAREHVRRAAAALWLAAMQNDAIS